MRIPAWPRISTPTSTRPRSKRSKPISWTATDAGRRYTKPSAAGTGPDDPADEGQGGHDRGGTAAEAASSAVRPQGGRSRFDGHAHPVPQRRRRQLAHGFGQGAAAASFVHGLPAPVAVQEMGFDRFDLGRVQLGAEVVGEAGILMVHGGDPPARPEPRGGAGPGGDGPESSHGGNLLSRPPPER